MKYQDEARFSQTGSMQTVVAVRLEGSGAIRETEKCQVAIEDAVTIDVKDVGAFTLMCTPSDAVPLAAGFTFTEGLIGRVEDIASLAECMDNPGVIRVILAESAQTRAKGRNLIVSSSCGLCGSRESVDGILSGIAPVGNTRKSTLDRIMDAVREMRDRQALFKLTGGTHAAAVFSADGKLSALAEDVGRHNALDKAIGKCLLGNIPTAGSSVTLSGRLSLEMVLKAARAGVEIVAAVSAASSLAVSAADRLNITLCGFAREERVTIFTHPERIG